LFYLNED